jgi:hypothetical protein
MPVLDQAVTDDYAVYNGDCVEVVRDIPSNSIGLSVYSPPFANLYIYSAHYNFLIPEIYRITRPGRLSVVHCKQLVNYKGRDGAAGLRDFRGEIIRAHQAHGWVYHSEVVIWMDPVLEMQRTKAHGLLYKQLRADSSFSRQGLAEYLLVFRKWPETDEDPDIQPVTHTKDEFPLDMWQRYASPVWYDIRRTNVLNTSLAREDRDEKHIAPLQLDVIERAVTLWSNPGDIEYSPFAGIGSEGYVSIQICRKFCGTELKPAYWRHAVNHCEQALFERKQPTLFDLAAAS